ncbi:SDR family oxidoreductase (plasmid) [Tistrella bauzanensis]|uniref:SDR family oxidoreductase n=1 Tax=Tistrella arctica TaxID=3133430 RepID=A0ABU9YLC4_9PROT
MTPSHRKSVLVAGGTGGIGHAVCTALAADGFDVAFTYGRNHDGAETLAAELAAAGARHVYRAVPLEDAAAVAAFADHVADILGRIDAVVYAAGPNLSLKPISALAPAEWSHVIDVDVKGAFHLVAATLPHLRRQPSSAMVAITTAAVARVPKADILSAAPKSAIETLFRGIAKEEGRNGIRANCVGPGWIDGGMGRRVVAAQFTPAKLDRLLAGTPLGRMGTPRDVAAAAAFLLSDAAGYITGQSLAVDGGLQL